MAETMLHSGEKIHYLSLALDARLAIKALRQGSASGLQTEVRESVKAALDSLKAISRGGELYAQLGELRPYQHFEQMCTLQEVFEPLRSSNLLDELQSVFDSESPSRQAKASALKFFYEVERRALHYYSDPSLSEQTG